MQIEPVTLEGNHVRLEPLSMSHVDALCGIGLDPGLWRWTAPDLRTPAQMREYVETALRWRDAGTALPFVTIERTGDTVVGSTRFANIEVTHRRAEIGWTWIARPWQRTAVNTEAKLLMLRHAFEVWRCQRVELKTDALNATSRRAIARLGATEEGTLRHHMLMADGRLRDTVYFSILAGEWPAVKDRLTLYLTRVSAHP